MRRSPIDRRRTRRRGRRGIGGVAAAGLLILISLGALSVHAQSVAPAAGAAPVVAPAPDAGAAPDANPPVDETADAMITRGVELRRHGDDQAALPVLRAAYQREPTPRAAAQLGFVEQALGSGPTPRSTCPRPRRPRPIPGWASTPT
jgi:hypothetical protein